MTLTVVGSIAFDAVRTPFGSRERMLGGSAVHFSLASSFFTKTQVVGPVGEDFGAAERALLEDRDIDCANIEQVPGGSTFFWRGHYDYDLNVAHTDETALGVFGDFQPKLSEEARACQTLFLGNIQPQLQREVAQQCAEASFVALDSMNLWVQTARQELIETIGLIDCLMLNDAELRMLTGKPNLLQAARTAMSWGPQAVVAKQGEYGCALFTNEGFFALPAFPLETVTDPTGAGDSFAGGFIGSLTASIGSLAASGERVTLDALKQAMAYGTALASFNVEEFGTERVARLTGAEISDRVSELHAITHFAAAPLALRG